MIGFQNSTYRRVCSSDAFATLVVCSAIFTDAFIYDLIIPFLPQMLQDRVGVPLETTQFWTSMLLASFGVSFFIANLTVGFVTDWVRSKRLVFLFGLLVMTASSLMLFLATNIPLLLVARGLQGVSASLVWVSGLAFLTSHIDKKNVGWAVGMTSVGMGAGELVGPALGGVMYEHAGHFAVLGLVCGIIAVDTVMRFMMVEKPSEYDTSPSVDEESERPLLPDGQREQQIVEQDSQRATWEARKDLPTISILGLKFNRDLCASCYAVANNSIILFSLEATLVVFVEKYFGWSTSASGGMIFAFVSPTLLSPAISGLTTRYGPRWSSVIFSFVGGCALIGLGFLTSSHKITQIIFVIDIVIIGSCTGALTTVHHIAFGVAIKKKEEQAKLEGKENASGSGKAFGSLTTAWAVGTCLGPVFSAVFLEYLDWLAFCLFLASLSLASAVILAFSWTEWENPGEDV